MLDCTTPKYHTLYARWLRHDDGLLDRGGLKRGDRVVDLCGGTGVISRQALGRGASEVVLFDLNPRPFEDFDPRGAFVVVKGAAEEAHKLLAPAFYDLVVCRQAIGYLDLAKTAASVAAVLKPGGRFVFNTFGKPRWLAKTYVLDGKRFFEAAGFLGDRVVHLQAGLGIGLDVTKFRWHKPAEIRAAMEKHFDVTEESRKNSFYYLCRKPL